MKLLVIICLAAGTICSTPPLNAQVAAARVLVPARISVATEAALSARTLQLLSKPSIPPEAFGSEFYSAGLLTLPPENCQDALVLEGEERLRKLFRPNESWTNRFMKAVLQVRLLTDLRVLGVLPEDIDRLVLDTNSVSISTKLPLSLRTTTFFALPPPQRQGGPRQLAAHTSDPSVFVALLRRFNNPPPPPPLKGELAKRTPLVEEECAIESVCYTPEEGWVANVRCGGISASISTNGAVSVSTSHKGITITVEPVSQADDSTPARPRRNEKNPKKKPPAPKDECKIESICFKPEGGWEATVKCGQLSASISTDGAISVSTGPGGITITAESGGDAQ